VHRSPPALSLRVFNICTPFYLCNYCAVDLNDIIRTEVGLSYFHFENFEVFAFLLIFPFIYLYLKKTMCFVTESGPVTLAFDVQEWRCTKFFCSEH